jgi:hypothetical protein
MPDQVDTNGGLAEGPRLPAALFPTLLPRAVLKPDASSSIDRQDDSRNKCRSR